MTEIREIFKTIQKYYGLFMNSGDENSSYSRHTEEQHLPSAECRLKTQAVCRTLQGNKYTPTSKSKISVLPQGVDMRSNSLAPCGRGQGEGSKVVFTEPSRGLSDVKDILKVDTNNAILRGLNSCSPQNDRKNICCLSRGEVRKTSRKVAFTLAEVLITLGIIGVVAALTLPTLIQNHQKQVYVTQLKKAYSTISNAFSKMAADEGVVDWNQTYCGSYTAPSDYNEEAFKVEKEYRQQCFENIAKQLNVINKAFEDCSEFWCWNYPDDYEVIGYHEGTSPVLQTADGALFFFSCSGLISEFYVDVNGATKGPNKPGRDVFAFYIYNSIQPYGLPNSWKNCSATNLSTNCTAKVLIEGKMNY